MREPCDRDRLPRDVRTFWVFGMDVAERRAAYPCLRPRGHRGPCLNAPPHPPKPLRRLLGRVP